jgi:CHAD domain-containing protein
MIKNEIKYLENLIRNNLILLQIDLNQDIIHQTRVSCKKLKSLLKLTKYKKHFKQYIKFYKKIGLVRDTYIKNNILKLYEIDKCIDIPEICLGDIKFKEYLICDENIEIESIKNKIENTIISLDLEINKHDLRKIIKDSYYWCTIITHELQEELKIISDFLGEWHDLEILIEDIEHFYDCSQFIIKRDFLLEESINKIKIIQAYYLPHKHQ